MPRGFDDIPGSLPPDSIPQDLDLNNIPFSTIAENALKNLTEADINGNALWRDHLSLTGQIRTFYGSGRIKEKWVLYTQERQPDEFKVTEVIISRPVPGTSWIDVLFTFRTKQEGGLIGNCSGIISFVPSGQDNGKWKVWMLRTILENFDGFGHPDDPSPIFQKSIDLDPQKASREDEHEVSVLILGAGQAGLGLAGRLGALSIPYLLLEKEAEIGYSWTGKYDAVRQHTIREMNNLPFDRTYKASDPNLLPAKIVAEGFQNYVKKYRINVWLGANVEECEQVSEGIGWVAKVFKGGKSYMVKARHLVLSMGAGRSTPNPPKIPGAELFRGAILDIGGFKNSSQWKGKRGIVVGSATGAHDGLSSFTIAIPLSYDNLDWTSCDQFRKDISLTSFPKTVAQDMLDNGLSSITMIQRSKTPIFPIDWVVAGQEGRSIPILQQHPNHKS